MTTCEYESILAEAMRDVATEIRMADARSLVALVHGNQAANLSDLVNSSTEMYFRSGTIRYALAAECDVGWNATPEVRIDMEFNHQHVCAFFRLILGGRTAGVELVDILFDETSLDDCGRRKALLTALSDARTPH